MSDFIVKGWCPGALRPMESGDGWVVRVRPPGGRLSRAQALGVAGLARAHGNGLIDLSARANVQLRGVTPESHGPLIEGLRDMGLIDADESTEARRNIVVTPFWTPGDGVQELAGELAGALAAADATALPGKFGFAIDTGAQPVLRPVSCDIRMERMGDQVLVYGSGAVTGAVVGREQAVAAAMALARWFAASGGINDGRGRMAAHLVRGAVLPAEFAAAVVPEAVAFAPEPGVMVQGTLAGFAFGQLQAETLAALAVAPLRVTPWRMLLVEAGAIPALPDVITDPADPLLQVIACTGAPGCPQGMQATRPLARRLAPHVPPGRSLHVSGCAKGCAHPGACDITLTATAAGFDLVRDGAAADTPLRAGLTARDLTPEVLSL